MKLSVIPKGITTILEALHKSICFENSRQTVYGNLGFSFILFKEVVTVKTETRQIHMVDHFLIEYLHLYKVELGQTRISKSLIKPVNFTADKISLSKERNIHIFYI